MRLTTYNSWVIKVFLNGEPREISSEIDLAKLLVLFSLPSQRIAIEVNDAVVRRIDWPLSTIKDGDKIEVVHFVGGG